jgi:hypothetical protein
VNKFKVGDKVVRKPKNRSDIWVEFCGRIGTHYCAPMSVSKVVGEYAMTLEGHDNEFWSVDCFEYVGTTNQPPPVPGIPEETPTPKVPDAVNYPQHYQFFPDLEAIEVIARSMTQEQFYGYCLGNRLKYRLRAGNKDKLEQDIAKSDKYSELYEQHRGKCIDAK